MNTPEAFGSFRVLHQIGAGTLGPVFRVYDSDRDRLVAIKLFQLDIPPERVHQLVGEFELLISATLTHAGLAAPLATGIDGNHAYLVQEFVAADSLDIVVRDFGPAPPADVLRLAVQLAGAIDFASVVNVEHGALHPRDVLISTEETRATGFGVTRALERVGVAPPVRRPYTAPERVSGGSWDRRADIFSLAALVHEMLWGRRIAATGGHAAEALTEIPGATLLALKGVFAKALAENPDVRYDTALEFAAALKAAFPTIDITEKGVGSRFQTEPEPVPDLVFTKETERSRPENDSRYLFEAEEARYQNVEEAPAIVPVVEPEPPAPPPIEFAAPAALFPDHRPPMETRDIDVDLRAPLPTPPPASNLFGSAAAEDMSPLERSRSAMWPLVLSFLVGGALMFGVGYAIGSHDRTPSVVAPPATTAQASAAVQPAAREFTDAAVRATPTPSPTPSPAPAAPRAGPAAVAPIVGRLSVKTTPPGARIFVDGRDRGKTPATIKDLTRGSHRVRLVYEGYATDERRVVINAAHLSQALTVPLARTRQAEAPAPKSMPSKPASFAGSLSVESRPPGAKVFIDGKPIGSTPLVLPQLAAGEHAVKIEHDGYRAWTSQVRIVSGERNRVTASLEK